MVEQLDNLTMFKKDNNNILLGDAGYDSNNIRNKLQLLKFGRLIAPKNKRNCKNKIILNTYTLSKDSKHKLKKRIKVERY